MRKIKASLIYLLFFYVVAIGSLSAQGIIAPNLQQRLLNVKSDEKIRINIRLTDQIDSDLLGQKTALTHDREELRALVTKELKNFSKISQQSLLSFLEGNEKSFQVSDIKSLWIVNLINCYATPEIIQQLSAMPGIARIDYDKLQQVLEPALPDAEPDVLTGKNNIAWNVSLINAPQVWEEGYTGIDVVVAVLDTGVNPNHQDLSGRMWTHPLFPNHGYNFVNNNFNTSDGHSHGTHCAGTVAGNGTAGTTTGIAPEATIMALKVLGDDGDGTEAGVWQAIEFAVDNGAHVMSLSLGWQHSWNPDRAAWRIAMENAMNAGVIAAVAAGNEGDGGGSAPPAQVRTPGDCPAPWTHPNQLAVGGNSAVVTVGSTTNTDALSAFSSRGPVTWQNIAPFNDYAYNPGTGLIVPDVSAPGSNILSLSNTNNSGYTTKSGTSMATPAVAGLMALMLSKNPGLTPQDIGRILEISANGLSPFKSNTFGSGRVNALTAIEQTPYQGIRYLSHSINDSNGNNNQKVNAGETIQISMFLENPTENVIQNVSVQLFTDSEYVTITQDNAFLGDFQSLDSLDFANIFTVEVSDTIPGDQVISFDFIATSTDSDDQWRGKFSEEVYAQHLVVQSFLIVDSIIGNNNGILDPGETGVFQFEIKNTGKYVSDSIILEVSTEGQWLILQQSGALGVSAIEPNESAMAYVIVSALIDAPVESSAELSFQIISGFYEYNSTGSIVIGQAPFYTQGVIPSTFISSPTNNSVALEPGQMSVTIPQNAVITGVDVQYKITSTAGAWLSEQRSILRCVSPGGTSEAALTPGPSQSSAGTADYYRTGLDIANGVDGGGEIDFELHVLRTWGGNGSSTQYAFVPNNTWKIIVHYELSRKDVAFKVTNQLGEPLSNATINVSSNYIETDELGLASTLLPMGNHFYSVSAPRHFPVDMKSFVVNEESDTLAIELTRFFKSEFVITDVLGNQPRNPYILVNDKPTSDFVADTLSNGLFNYVVSVAGYVDYIGTFEIIDNDIVVELVMEPIFIAGFTIRDTWGNSVENATIFLNDQPNSEGVYQLRDLFIGNYQYKVTAPYYFENEGSLDIIDRDVAIEIILQADGTSISSIDADMGIRIFPNPASSHVKVKTAKKVLEIFILDLNGKTVYYSAGSGFDFHISTAELEDGLYFLKLVFDDSARIEKLQINQ